MHDNQILPPVDRPIILASQSPRRSALLKQIGLDFSVQPAEVDESGVDTAGISPEQIAVSLASRKTDAIARKQSAPAYVIGADTIVCIQDTLLGKPTNSEEAYRILRQLSGHSHTVITGVSIAKVPEQQSITFSERTEVHFHDLSDAEIKDYISSGEPMDKAGAYGIQGYGALLVDYIHGDYNNVVGFPLAAFYRHFRTLLFP